MLKVFIDFNVPEALFALEPTLALSDRLQIPIDWQPLYCPPVITPAPQDNETRGETHARIKQALAVKTADFYAEIYQLSLNPPSNTDTTLARACLLQLEQAQRQAFVRACINAYWHQGQCLNDQAIIQTLLDSLQIDQAIDLSSAAVAQLESYQQHTLQQYGFLHSPSYIAQQQIFIGRQHLPLIENLLTETTAEENPAL